MKLCIFSSLYKGHRGNTIIHYAAMGGELGVIDQIIGRDKCPVINRQNDLSETPLHLAAGCFTKCEFFPFTVFLVVLSLNSNYHLRIMMRKNKHSTINIPCNYCI